MKFEETEAKPTFSKMVDVDIDSDSLIYRACHAGEKEHREEERVLEETVGRNHPLFTATLNTTMIEKQRTIFHSMVDGIIWKMREGLNAKGVDIATVTLVFTPKKKYCDENNMKVNFRYEIIEAYNATVEDESLHHPPYKHSRRGMALPEGIPEMFEYVAEALDNQLFSNHSEADDVVYRRKVDRIDDVVIACLDKDIFEGTPSGDVGHYNFNKDEWVFTTEEEAHLFFYRQCMTGDSSDGIKGIYRYGPKTAEKDLPEFTDHEDMWQKVIDIFFAKGYTEEYAILMMRLVNLSQLDSCGNLVLWEPPFRLAGILTDGPGFQDNELPVSVEPKKA